MHQRELPPIPDHLIDIKIVIAWVREHGYEYGADPTTIFLAGNSTGGHFAAIAALTPNAPLSNRVLSVWTRRSLPPFFLAGDQDRFVPVEAARLFAKHLSNSSTNPVVYVELPRAEHNFDLFHSIRTEAVVHGIEAFASWVLANNKYNSYRT
ncbi:alpha/beta hydrolase [Bacillus pseudomycoides]|uniref:alpha/beta hydrolase n=1 Tax=Bacillus pseudomycoides TaxID=64104 RepID=UPI0015D51FE1|nr:alpha/beta hydrolase [Bacillus pseudomycoides]